ncbi:MAG TPA: GNAT family N-acetyltransferase [Nocardioidaceae bacterium]|nr:GNAT family N-acetyltransferase [Nocardioidaceae bacterium]
MGEALGLRPATDADREFCFALHEATLREYVAAIWGWDDATQREFFDRGWDPSVTDIVTRDGHDIGVIKVEERAEVTYLGLIEIHPDHQGGGVGAELIQDLVADAARRGRAVELDVLSVNTRAAAFYRRRGFVEQYRHGDDNIRIRMRRDPTL